MSGSEMRYAKGLLAQSKRVDSALSKQLDQAKVKKEEIEADQNILVHLRKSIDDDTHETQFLTGEKEVIPQDVAQSVLNHVLKLKPEARLEVQEYLQQSFENVIEVAQLIRGSK